MRTMILLSAMMFLTVIGPAHAYIGPGLGLGAIGAVLGVILSVFLAIFALVWFPIKRRMKARKEREQSADADMQSQ